MLTYADVHLAVQAQLGADADGASETLTNAWKLRQLADSRTTPATPALKDRKEASEKKEKEESKNEAIGALQPLEDAQTRTLGGAKKEEKRGEGLGDANGDLHFFFCC